MAAAAAISLAVLGVSQLPSFAYELQSARATVAESHLPSADEMSATFENVAETIKPSVVSIRSVKKVAVAQPFANSPFEQFFGDDFMQRFFSNPTPRDYVERGLGTGVIVGEDGYILTNNHVVGGADEVEVQLPDNRTLRAKVVGTDAKTDLAVLKVDATGLHAARLGDSDGLKVGQWVVAVGNPFGLTSSITAGIVSAKGRENMGLADYEDFIQTDAAINPGNSGGPLVDLTGKVVGINTAIFTRSGGYMGIGFAIPINLARGVMTSLMKNGHVVRGWLGVVIQDLDPGLASSFGFSGTDGALVSQVTPNGPADHAGLRSGDIVTRFDGHPVTGVSDLRGEVADTAPGRRVAVDVFRDGHRRTFQVTLAEQGGNTVASAQPQDTQEKLGMTLHTLTPDIARELHQDPELHGVLVTGLTPLGPAERAGLRPNDIILSVQGTPVSDAAALRGELAKHDLKKGVRLGVRTGSMRRFVFLQADHLS